MSQVVNVLGDRLLLKISRETEEVRDSGIIVNHVNKHENQIGEIVSVGSGCLEEFEVGQKVAYSKYGAEDTTDLGEHLVFVKEDDVLAIVK